MAISKKKKTLGKVTTVKNPKGGKVFGLETLEPVDWLPKGYLSVSAASMYQRCGKQFEFRYIDGLKEPPGVAMTEGSSHHDWLEANNVRKIQTGEDMAVKPATTMFLDYFSDNAKRDKIPMIYRNEAIERGPGLVKVYLENVASTLTPVRAENKFEIMMGDVPVFGFTDFEGRVEDPEFQKGAPRMAVADYKVAARKKSVSDAENSLQLATYAKATGIKETKFITLAKTKEPKVHVTRAAMSPQRQAWAREIFIDVGKSIKAGVFPLAQPDSWACSDRFCGFWDRCRGSKRLK